MCNKHGSNIVVFHACRKPYANPKFPFLYPLASLLGLFTGRVAQIWTWPALYPIGLGRWKIDLYSTEHMGWICRFRSSVGRVEFNGLAGLDHKLGQIFRFLWIFFRLFWPKLMRFLNYKDLKVFESCHIKLDLFFTSFILKWAFKLCLNQYQFKLIFPNTF